MTAEHSYNDDELRLLRAARLETPPEGSAAGVFAALGLAPVGPVPGPEGEPAPVSSARPLTRVEAPPRSGIFAKPAAWVALGGAALLALSPWALSVEAPEKNSAPVTRMAEPEPVQKELAPNEKVFTLAELDAGTDPDLEPSRTAPLAAGSTPAEVGRTESEDAANAVTLGPSLADELAQIKKARGFLQAGDLSGCAGALAEHSRRFSPPRLSTEALVIRVELLLRQGKTAEAKRLAAPLLTENSPYRARISTLLSHP